MNLRRLKITDNIVDFIEAGNYDGIAVVPYQTVICPICKQPAIIVRAYLRGHGGHNVYRCSANRNHQEPVFWSPAAEQWMLAEYTHSGLVYRIVPKVELEAAA